MPPSPERTLRVGNRSTQHALAHGSGCRNEHYGGRIASSACAGLCEVRRYETIVESRDPHDAGRQRGHVGHLNAPIGQVRDELVDNHPR